MRARYPSAVFGLQAQSRLQRIQVGVRLAQDVVGRVTAIVAIVVVKRSRVQALSPH